MLIIMTFLIIIYFYTNYFVFDLQENVLQIKVGTSGALSLKIHKDPRSIDRDTGTFL